MPTLGGHSLGSVINRVDCRGEKADDMECLECGRVYIKDIPKERRAHRTYHDMAVNGVPSRSYKTDRVIWKDGNARLLVVRHRVAPIRERARAEYVAMLANREMRFDCAAYHARDSDGGRDPHVFLLDVDGRFVGFLVVERCEHVQRFTWDQYDQPTGGVLPQGDPVWTICMVWVHRKHRRRGIGSTLVAKATEFLGVSATDIGWYTPFTESGRALARRMCPESFLIAK